MAADRLRAVDFLDARERPCVSPRGGLVSFEPELHHLPAGCGLAIDQPQFGVRLICRFAQEIIRHARGVELGHRITLGHAQQKFTERGVADVEFDFGVNRQLAFAEMGYASTSDTPSSGRIWSAWIRSEKSALEKR